MIDMHSHILYGVDDGCKTIEDSIKMINKALSVGVTDIILTPHYAPLRGYVASFDEVNDRFIELKEKIIELGIKINLFLGREIDRIDDIGRLLSQKVVHPINHTKFVLIDFGMEKTDIDEYCYEIILHGYIPIIAHPERYNYIKNENEYKKWKKTGALIQINASSLVHTKSKNTKKVAKFLLKNNLVDFIGSDVHNNEASYDYFKQAFRLISKKATKLLKISNEKLI